MPDPREPILICFAMAEEARPLQKLFPSDPRASILVTGMGRANTERVLRASLASDKPAAILTCGFAGGLDPCLRHDEIVFQSADEALAKNLLALGARPIRFHCADRMIVTAEEKRMVRQQTGADAVEMESYWVEQICRQQNLPCATVRVISDTAHETMPLDFNTLTTAEMKMDYGKLALALLRAPGKLPGLLRLQRQTQAAAEALALFLHRLLAK